MGASTQTGEQDGIATATNAAFAVEVGSTMAA
jgi:hypothetical protein